MIIEQNSHNILPNWKWVYLGGMIGEDVIFVDGHWVERIWDNLYF